MVKKISESVQFRAKLRKNLKKYPNDEDFYKETGLDRESAKSILRNLKRNKSRSRR